MMVMLMARRGADEEDEVMLPIKLERRDENGKVRIGLNRGKREDGSEGELKMGT